ncbi:MAG: hypothetical protein ACHQ52_11120, partial [Candidatus Eisenbacteria bacterium]
ASNGRRCEERTRLEFDHMDPVARGGESTADRIRLRCRAHNQYEAERVFGERFMRGKREEAVRKAAERRACKRPEGDEGICVTRSALVAASAAGLTQVTSEPG